MEERISGKTVIHSQKFIDNRNYIYEYTFDTFGYLTVVGNARATAHRDSLQSTRWTVSLLQQRVNLKF